MDARLYTVHTLYPLALAPGIAILRKYIYYIGL